MAYQVHGDPQRRHARDRLAVPRLSGDPTNTGLHHQRRDRREAVRDSRVGYAQEAGGLVMTIHRYVAWEQTDDTGDGTSVATAKKTIGAAETLAAALGGTDVVHVHVRAGVYRERVNLSGNGCLLTMV